MSLELTRKRAKEIKKLRKQADKLDLRLFDGFVFPQVFGGFLRAGVAQSLD